MRFVLVSTLICVFLSLLSASVLLEEGLRLNRAASDMLQVHGVEITRAPEPDINASHSINGLRLYDDHEYGFSLAVPEGWTKVVADESDISGSNELLATLDQGYAVGFESPQADRYDRFADYILIEVMPGVDSGLFESTLDNQEFLQVGEEQLAYDRLDIDSETDDNIDVDLVIFQRGVQALGYTLSFYAIGEPANEKNLFEAFQIMLHTYTQNEAPFEIL